MGRLANLVVLIVVVLVAVGAFLFLGQDSETSSFEGFSELEKLMASKGVEIRGLEADDIDRLSSLSETDLSELKSGILLLQSEYKSPSFGSVSTIYLDITEVLEIQKQLDKSNSIGVAAGLSDPCAQITRLRQRNALEAQRIQAMEELFQGVNSFVANFPSENRVARFEHIEIDLDVSKNNLEESNAGLSELEALCG